MNSNRSLKSVLLQQAKQQCQSNAQQFKKWSKRPPRNRVLRVNKVPIPFDSLERHHGTSAPQSITPGTFAARALLTAACNLHAPAPQQRLFKSSTSTSPSPQPSRCFPTPWMPGWLRPPAHRLVRRARPPAFPSAALPLSISSPPGRGVARLKRMRCSPSFSFTFYYQNKIDCQK